MQLRGRKRSHKTQLSSFETTLVFIHKEILNLNLIYVFKMFEYEHNQPTHLKQSRPRFLKHAYIDQLDLISLTVWNLNIIYQHSHFTEGIRETSFVNCLQILRSDTMYHETSFHWISTFLAFNVIICKSGCFEPNVCDQISTKFHLVTFDRLNVEIPCQFPSKQQDAIIKMMKNNVLLSYPSFQSVPLR